MTKLLTPLLSFEAHKSVGNALTFQKRSGTNFVRKKPTPAYRRTLAQMYQRWLYEDYANLWTQQSEATRRTYASAGVRYHLTAFQYWMKYHLTYLSNIIGLWYLDEDAGITARDMSRNALNATIFGASPVDGIVGGAYLLDGINDRIVIPNSALLNTTSITIDFWIKFHSFIGAWDTILSRDIAGGRQFTIHRAGGRFVFDVNLVAPNANSASILSPAFETWVRWCFQYSSGGTAYAWENGVLKDQRTLVAGDLVSSTQNLDLGRWNFNNTRYSHFTIDDLLIYDYVIPETLIINHAERRHPS